MGSHGSFRVRSGLIGRVCSISRNVGKRVSKPLSGEPSIWDSLAPVSIEAHSSTSIVKDGNGTNQSSQRTWSSRRLYVSHSRSSVVGAWLWLTLQVDSECLKPIFEKSS